MKNERGYALLIVLLTIVLISVIGISLLTVSSNTLNTSANERVNQSSFYIAEAGINIKAARIQQLIQQKYNSLLDETKDNPEHFITNFKEAVKLILTAERQSIYNEAHFKSNANGTPNAEVTVEYDPNNPFHYKIVSTGHFSGNHKRTLVKSFSIQSTPVNLAKIYVTDKLDLKKVNNDSFNAEVFYKQPYIKDLDEWQVKDNIHLNQNINVPSPQKPNMPPVSINFNVDSSIANVDSNLFETKESSIKKDISLTSPQQKLVEDMKFPKIKDDENIILNLHVDDTRNLYSYLSSFKHEFSNLTINVTGNGTLNLIFMKGLDIEENATFNIIAPNTKVNIFSNGDIDIDKFGKFNANDIFIKKGDLKMHEGSTVNTHDIVIENGSIQMSEYTKEAELNARNILLYNGHIDIENESKVTAENIFLKDGHIKFDDKSILTAKDITIEKGTINMFEFADNAELYAHNILLYRGHLDIADQSIVKAQNISLKDGHIKLDDESELDAQDIFIEKGSIKIGAADDNSIIIAHDIFINEGHIHTEDGTFLTANTIVVLDSLSGLSDPDGKILDGVLKGDKDSTITAHTIYAKEEIEIYAEMTVNSIYSKKVTGNDHTRINALEGFISKDSLLDPSQLISSTPVVEVQ